MRRVAIGIILICNSLSVIGQTVADSSVTIVKELEDVEVVQQRSSSFVEQQPERMVVDVGQIRDMPKFLGTSDPLRYLQSLAGIQTNNETTTGLHIHGCDDYHTQISINGAPVYYPNHLLGLYSTFIGSHFHSITVEPAEHKGTAGNRIGGLVDFKTIPNVPKRFGLEGNVGIINSDITLAVPIGQRNAFWLSARSSYINALYSNLLTMEGYRLKYHFMDFNLTYLSRLTENDRLTVSAFYSRDQMGLLSQTGKTDMIFPWQNIVGSINYHHRFDCGNWHTTAFYSSFDNQLNMAADTVRIKTHELFSSVGLKNLFDWDLTDAVGLSVALDYEHYLNQPLYFIVEGSSQFSNESGTKQLRHADELSLGADLRHEVCPWFTYYAGVHLAGFVNQSRCWGAVDPRVSAHFTPAENHTISVHYGMYHQYFHKSGLTSGGLPTDFFFLATERFQPELAHSTSLKYTSSFLKNQYSISAELYFKQIYNVVESTGNVLQVLNRNYSFEDDMIVGKGRNYGFNLMFQRNTGIVTGYVSYSLGRARRSFPALDGYTDYRYSASSERIHDLKVVLNSRFAKRWTVGAMFVLASGQPYTEAKEAYMLNGKMVCLYSTFNSGHLPLYHRLDLSCSCDIIKTEEHELGINLSLYNAYAHRNAQFVVYKDSLQPIFGTSLSTIIPSISLYGKF